MGVGEGGSGAAQSRVESSLLAPVQSGNQAPGEWWATLSHAQRWPLGARSGPPPGQQGGRGAPLGKLAGPTDNKDGRQQRCAGGTGGLTSRALPPKALTAGRRLHRPRWAWPRRPRSGHRKLRPDQVLCRELGSHVQARGPSSVFGRGSADSQADASILGRGVGSTGAHPRGPRAPRSWQPRFSAALRAVAFTPGDVSDGGVTPGGTVRPGRGGVCAQRCLQGARAPGKRREHIRKTRFLG